MKLSEFDYDLPKELIAQTPRDGSRLLVVNRKDSSLKICEFKEIIDYFNPGDCIIFNDSKVISARIFAKEKYKNFKVEFLIIKYISNNIWEVLAKPGKKVKIGSKFIFDGSTLEAKIIESDKYGIKKVEFSNCEDFYKEIERIGTTPLPPYIREKLKDKSRYQTIYAKNPGSVAAPTAGLHFTKDLMDKLKKKGINFGFLTLHVSLGTFAPVRVENIEDHIMHSEIFTLPEETANTINETRSLGKKVIAVGTTSCRTLEATALEFGLPIKTNLNSTTNIFIKPGFKFSVVDSLITNFHLPKSTLVMLVCAFADKKLIKSAYEKAIKNKMKFFSFGDAMLII